MNLAGLQDIIRKMTGCSFYESRMEGTRRASDLYPQIFDLDLIVVRIRDGHGLYEKTNIIDIVDELQALLGKESRITLHVRG